MVISLIVLAILLALALVAISWLVAENRALWRLMDRSDEGYARVVVGQSRQIRRLTRERNNWELAATRAIGIRLQTPKPASSGDLPKSTRRFVSPSEAINRTKQEEAGFGHVPPPAQATETVPPAIAKKFLEDAQPGR